MKQAFFFFCFLITTALSAQSADKIYAEAEAAAGANDFAKALKLIDKAIQKDSTEAKYYRTKGDYLMELKQYQQAYDTYTYGIKRFPTDCLMLNNRGNILIEAKQFDLAIEDLSAAILFATNDSIKYSILVNRSAAKSGKRDFEGAYDDLSMAISFFPNEPSVFNNLGLACMELGRNEEALKYLLKVIEIDSSFFIGYINAGYIYQRMGQYEKSIELLNKSLKINPKDPFTYSNLSYNKLKLGDIKGAMKDIETSIKLNPYNSYAYRNRALIYLEQGKTKKACEDLQKALDNKFTLMYGPEVEELQQKHCK